MLTRAFSNKVLFSYGLKIEMHAHNSESSPRRSNFNFSRMLQYRDLNAMLTVSAVQLKTQTSSGKGHLLIQMLYK